MRIEPIIFGTVLLVLASIVTALGAKGLHDVLAFRRRSVLVQGRFVCDKHIVLPGDTERSYAHQVSFQCPFLKQRRLISASMASGIQSSRPIGSPMAVLVHSDPPHRARVATFSNLYVLPIALLLFGVPFLFAMAAYIARHLP